MIVDPMTLGRDFRISVEDVDCLSRPIRSLNDAAQRINAETEKWCARAAAEGEGYRLFRSDPRYEHDVTGHRAVVGFQILAPGEGAPASGIIFGPWPEGE